MHARVILIGLSAIAACGPKPAETLPRPAAPITGGGAVTPPPGPPKTGAKGGSTEAGFVPAPDIGCPAPTCAFHAGAGQYFTCLAGGAGVCFHFGAACIPTDKCMFDPADRVYKTCKTAGEGTCSAWGAACAPATKCMIEPATGLAKTCDHPANGTCAAYGALCSP